MIPAAVGAGAAAGAAGPGKADYVVMRLFYVTDRAFRPQNALEERYTSDRNSDPNPLTFGSMLVNIPRDHEPGMIEKPVIWKFRRKKDYTKDMFLVNISPFGSQQAFYADVRRRVQQSPKKQAFVFVHGFNNSFEDAALRMAQFTYDLGFDGAPILYSWPSQGKGSPLAYTADENTILWTTPHLEAFLREVSDKTGAETIYLVAHSMGARAMTSALEDISRGQPATAKQPFRGLILAAPDIDAGVFLQLSDAMKRMAQRVTLYASSSDEALKASEKVNKYQRAGQGGADILVIPGIDTVDVSAVDTGILGLGNLYHSYWAANVTVLSDMFRLLILSLPPSQRCGLNPASKGMLPYWIFAKPKECLSDLEVLRAQ